MIAKRATTAFQGGHLLAVPGNPPVDVGIKRLADLRRQLDTKRKPVLRQQQFRDCHLDRAISLVVDMAARVS